MTQKSSGRIFVFGSINLDLIAAGEHLPKAGETVRANSFVQAPGGKGANQALAAARAGANVLMCGATGTDDFAGAATAILNEASVDLSHVAKLVGDTGIAIILVEASGENVISIVAGANGQITPAHAKETLATITEGDILLCQLEVPEPAVAEALRIANENGATSILNIAPVSANVASLANEAQFIIANETEFDQLDGQDDASSRQQRLMDRAKATGKTIIVTLGEDGAMASHAGKLVQVPSHKVNAIDAVGAGDTFCGYLATGLLEGQSIENVLKLAVAAGALACTKSGAQPAVPARNEVDELAGS